jgi:hypothetical protein
MQLKILTKFVMSLGYPASALRQGTTEEPRGAVSRVIGLAARFQLTGDALR